MNKDNNHPKYMKLQSRTKSSIIQEYVCNVPLDQPQIGHCYMKVRVPFGAQDLEKIEKLGNRWLLIIDDRNPARGPIGNGALPEVFAKATFAAVVSEPSLSDDLFYYGLFTYAVAGARVVLVITDLAHLSEWDLFILRKGALQVDTSVPTNAAINGPGSDPANSSGGSAAGRTLH